ncbi:hypothetical protein Mgra_00003284 [Meloidogyne graminicola]|uniref:Uncharacterized protein n=1 Tax=Meloidogyne graminicola TaxID=189291 RepID=A0A8S9ZVK6_9BILA|nr:hypothetical protein Mgra_00003284 [Meloidogyne graminicola]
MGERNVDLSAYVPPNVKGGSISGGQLQQAPATKPTSKDEPPKQKPSEPEGIRSSYIDKYRYSRPSSYTCTVAGQKNPKK